MLKRVCKLCRMQFLCRIVLYFVCIVTIFAFINWITFLYNPTSFIFSEQMNRHVVRPLSLASNSTEVSYIYDFKDSIPISVNDAYTLIRPYYVKLDSIQNKLKYHMEKYEEYILLIDSMKPIIEEDRSNAINNYRDSALHNYCQQIDSLEDLIKVMKSTKLYLGDIYEELDQLKSDYLDKSIQVSDFIVKHFGSFSSDTLFDKYRLLTTEKITIENNINDLRRKQFEVKSYIDNFMMHFLDNRRDVIGLVDFFYYSFCVSTTVSFGDIAPNNGWTRTVAIAELLLCIVLIGIILDRINKSIKGKND